MTLIEKIEASTTILISGHIRPDGDCAGSCLGLWNYIKDNYPEKKPTVCIEQVSANLKFLPGSEQIIDPTELMDSYDLFVSLDCSTIERLGPTSIYLEKAIDNMVIDHHVTNVGFGKDNVIVGEASSACEVLYELLEDEKISLNAAICLYTGIIHDTGVLKYRATKERTMQIAGRLMSRGIDTAKLIDESFYQKTFLQTKLCAYAVSKAELCSEGRICYTVLSMDDMKNFGAIPSDTEGIIDQLRLVKGVEAAIFAREDDFHTYKFSLRSKNYVDVSSICAVLGGGGHKFAAGVTVSGNISELVEHFCKEITKQLH